ncbi:DUF3667 domain-containing protein [Aquimarina sp. MMG016]|uniref:DUF3667 domain-containing protein n=1 Tax=Aquimarina sp. MMG016 TaxID=2822690 RepID=UPI001B39E51F|nr:DUF3667 domain-containing protein [Aquimarina sp. MMG016]MBQ4819320.1 DUF3667 domain-containing protein [Aquimarina sp. MMG016]
MNETIENDESQEIKNLSTLERIDGKYIWNEISSVLNFDKGIFYTIKELFIRPGKTVREFLMYDRKRLVKPIIFLIFSSLFFVISQQFFGFQTGAAPDNIDSVGVQKAFEWVGKNFGIVNIILGFFIGFWIRLFYLKSKFNIYEIFILVFFTIGVGNLIFTIFGIIEIGTGFDVNSLAYLVALLYSAWAIGNFFNKKSFWSYFKGLLAYIFGTTTGSILIFLVGILIDILNKSS